MKKYFSRAIISILFLFSAWGLFAENCDGEITVSVNKENFITAFSIPDAVYEICEALDFSGKELVLPSNVTLRFIAGSIQNAVITFDKTTLEGEPAFHSCSYSGHLENNEIVLSWFESFEKEIDIELNKDNHLTKKARPLSAKTFEELIAIAAGKTLVADKLFVLEDTVFVSKKITLKGNSSSAGIYGVNYQNAEYGFVFPDAVTGFVVTEGGDLSLRGISIIGTYGLYISGNLWENYAPEWYPVEGYEPRISICGIDVKSGGRLSSVLESTVNTFTYGIRLNKNSSAGVFKNTYFSSCRYGLWADGVSDLSFNGCRFNTNLVNFPFQKRSVTAADKPVLINDGAQLRKTGGGLYLRDCRNVLVERCRFEFNNIHLIIDECGKNLTFTGNIFDTGSACQVLIYNAENVENEIKRAFSADCPAMENILFTCNSMARGARQDYWENGRAVSDPGFGIFYIAEGNNRGAKVEISNNIISDELEMEERKVTYEPQVFCIFNNSKKGSVYTVSGNSFAGSKADYLYYVIPKSKGRFFIIQDKNKTGSLMESGGNTKVLSIKKDSGLVTQEDDFFDENFLESKNRESHDKELWDSEVWKTESGESGISLKNLGFTTDKKVEAKTAQNAALLEQIIKTNKGVIIVDDFYPLAHVVKVEKSVVLKASDNLQEAGFYTVNATDLFSVHYDSELSLYGLKLSGLLEKDGNLSKAEETACIRATYDREEDYYKGSVGKIYDCIIEDFYYGVWAVGTYLERIQNTVFDSCEYGIYALWTSDFDVFDCRFLNCGHEEPAENTSAAIYIAAAGMVNMNSNYFENNNISIALAYGDVIFCINDNYFKASRLCDIAFITAESLESTPITQADLYETPFDCINIFGNRPEVRVREMGL